MTDKERIRATQKKTGEELQEFLAFRRKGFKVPAKKGKGSYDRRRFKRGDAE